MIPLKISFAGAGKVATALCQELYSSGHLIQQIVSRGEKSGLTLAEKCDAVWSDKLNYLNSNDIIIVAVSDNSLNDVLKAIKCHKKTIIIHTAGSYGMEVFPENTINRGVFYPLQTFSEERKTEFIGIPIFLESSDEHTERVLISLAESLGCSVHIADTEHRKLLHIAAVFVSNFTNHMFTTGKVVASKAGFSFEVLKPLINETVKKALEEGPENSQTGPAVRNDLNTIKKHLDLLSYSPGTKEIYDMLTKAIIQFYKEGLQDE